MSESNIKNTLERISEDFGLKNSQFSALSGGNINQVYLIESSHDKFVVKINNASRFPGMFEAEKLGLEKLREPDIIDVPKPLRTGEVDSYSYLIIEHKQERTKRSSFWEDFSEKLAKMHKQTRPYFGLENDNYIGSLPQYNSKRDSAPEFYIEMRLEPQLKMAREKGFDLNVKNSFYKNCENLIPQEASSLVHGDLWGGNYLVNSEGLACLIDPAVAFAPRELDIGMMKLFGGFDETFFQTYNECFPLEPGWKERIPLWQLYYLLVHLNIFGAGYFSRVDSIIKKFS